MERTKVLLWRVRLPVAMMLLVLVSMGTWLSVGSGPVTDPMVVYPVGSVQTAVARDPTAWLGRTVLVRSVITIDATALCRTAACADTRPVLVDPGAVATSGLPLGPGPPSPLWALLRSLPLVRTLAPLRPIPRWGRVAVYRLRLLRSGTALYCDLCAEGVLLDVDSSGM